MTVTRSTDHVARGVAKFIGPVGKPLVQAWMAVKLAEIQKLEDCSWEVADYYGQWQTLGFGIILDNIGEIVGRRRNGLDDIPYKVAIRAQGAINKSTGKQSETIFIGELSTNEVGEGLWTSRTFHPKSRLVEYLGELDEDTYDPIIVNLTTLAPAGTRSDFVYSVSPRAITFICGIESDPTIGAGDQGCGVESDPTVGGRLSAVVKL